MAITIVATVAGHSSNSYITQTEADAFFALVTNFAVTWAALTSDQKAQRIIMACRAIDRFSLISTKYDPEQTMKFPRAIGDPALLPIQIFSPTVIDLDVKNCVYEMIMFQYFNADTTTGQMSRDIS